MRKIPSTATSIQYIHLPDRFFHAILHDLRVNDASSDLNQFWRKEREFLGRIRNALVAHRDHDTLRYVESLENLKPMEVMARAAELSPLLDRLIRVLSPELCTEFGAKRKVLEEKRLGPLRIPV
jgi:hypothetical protein